MSLVAPSQVVVETLGGPSEHGSGSADPTFASTRTPSAEGPTTSQEEALILRADTIAFDRFLGDSSGSALGGDHNNIQIHNQNTYLLHPRPTVSPATSTPTVIEESGGRRDESATETYTRIMLAKRIGYPLWTPEPFNIPPEYEAEGIQVGDIGIVNEDGLFEFSFNFCRPAEDPINSAFPLPDSFEPFTYAPVQVVQTDGVFWPNTTIGNGSVRGRLTYPSPRTGDEAGPCQFQFDCFTPEGAILALPTGACRTNFRSSFRRPLFSYVCKHALSWLKWVYGSLDLASSLYLITGYDKCDNWCLASHSNVPAEIGVSLSFTPEVDSGGFVQYSPQYSGDIIHVTARTFLRRGIISKNQCLFLRGYKITTCKTLQERLRWGTVPGAAVLDWFFSQLFNGGRNGEGNTSGEHHNDSFQIESFPSPSRIHHPADIINLYLLTAHPTAQVAITHDDDWCGVIEESDITFPDPAELLRRVLTKYRQVQDGDCVTLVPGEDQAVMVDPLQSVGHQTEDFGAEASPVPHAVRACFSPVAVPRLSPSFTLFKLIWSLNRRIQPPEQQMESLVLSIAQLLQNLQGELLTGRILPSSGHTEIADLYSILTDIATFITDKTERGVLIVPANATIENYRHRFESCAFQISELIRVQDDVDSPAHTPLLVSEIHGHIGQAARGKSLSITDSAAPTKTSDIGFPDAAEPLRRVLKKYRQVQEGGEDLAVMASKDINLGLIKLCLDAKPVPFLEPAFALFLSLWDEIEAIEWSKQQLEALAFSIAQLLSTLNRKLRKEKSRISKSLYPEIANLKSIIEDIQSFIQTESKSNFVRLLFTNGDRVAKIGLYQSRLEACVAAFQVSALIDIEDWQRENERGRIADQKDLNSCLDKLESDHSELAVALGLQSANMSYMTSMMATLQKFFLIRRLDKREHQFYSTTLKYLAETSGRHIRLESWMITSYEVEFGKLIGSGGFGEVYEGTWNRTKVALKVLRTDSGGSTNTTFTSNEIKTWMNLGHPNILRFFGANIFDNRPFIVMQYMRNGNARDYIHMHPDCDRIVILHQISIGLAYLHISNVLHGDLKASNVLIDDAGMAVLCDFGLSVLNTGDSTGSTQSSPGQVTGSLNWMAPERLLRGPLTTAIDIYAYGMTVYEVLTGEVPLNHINYQDFVQSVVHDDVRPVPPQNNLASTTLWSLARACWSKDPSQRPTVEQICDTMQKYVLRSGNGSSSLIVSLQPSPPSKSEYFGDLFGEPLPELEFNPLPTPPRSTADPILRNIETGGHKTHATQWKLFGFTFGKRKARKFTPFCIDDRDHGHPIPKCSNPSVEKWTLDDMLDRWVMRSLDRGIDEQFQSILLSTYESFSTPMDLFQGLQQRFQAAENELGHPELWVRRRLDILSRILHWVESPFAPTDPQVIAEMKTFAGLIVFAKYSPSQMRARANGIQAVLEQKEQQLSRVVIANQQPADLRPLRRLSANEIATTLTALERFMSQGIHPADYIAYLRNLDRPGAKRVADVHRLAEGIKHWILREVLYPDEVVWRRKNLKLFLEVAGECWQAQNFATATTILRVLNSDVLRRLPDTFAELDAERPNRLRELTRLVQSHLKDGTPFDPNTPCMAHMESRLRGLTAILPKCNMACDRECPQGWVNISSCLDLAEIMLEIANLQMSVEKVDSDDRSLVYLWQFAQVEAGAADDRELESRSKELAEEEDSHRFQRAINVQKGFKRSLSAASGRPVPPNA